MKGWGVPAKLGTEEDVGKWAVHCNLDEMVTKGTEWCDKVWMVLVKFVVLGDVYQKVAFDVLILGGPNLLATSIDDLVLVWVMVGGGVGWGSKKVGEKFGFWEDGKREDVTGRSRWGKRWDGSDRGDNDGWQEVLDWDVSKQDALDNLLKLLVDVGILWFRVGVLELRTREVVLLGSDVSENLKEVGRGGNEDRRGGSDRDNRWRVDNKRGKEGEQANRGVWEDRDGEAASGVAIWAWIVPGIVGTIEEVLNDLVGGSDVYLVDVINLRPRGDRKGRGGNSGGGDGGDKRR